MRREHARAKTWVIFREKFYFHRHPYTYLPTYTPHNKYDESENEAWKVTCRLKLRYERIQPLCSMPLDISPNKLRITNIRSSHHRRQVVLGRKRVYGMPGHASGIRECATKSWAYKRGRQRGRDACFVSPNANNKFFAPCTFSFCSLKMSSSSCRLVCVALMIFCSLHQYWKAIYHLQTNRQTDVCFCFISVMGSGRFSST